MEKIKQAFTDKDNNILGFGEDNKIYIWEAGKWEPHRWEVQKRGVNVSSPSYAKPMRKGSPRN